MSHWNYRVIRHKQPTEDGDYFQIHEVYYEDDGRPSSVTVDGAQIGGDDLTKIAEVLERIKRCLGEPTLDYDSFGSGKDPK